MFNPAKSISVPMVILADSSESGQDLVASMLIDKGLGVRSARTGDEALDLVEQFSPDVLVLDPNLRTSSGEELLSVLAEEGPERSPVVLVNSDDPIVIRQGIEAGAYDQISTSAHAICSLARIDAAIHTKRLRDEVLYQRGALDRLVRVDALTGLANRNHLEASLSTLAATAKRHERPLSVVLMDIDRLAQINDEAGTEAGDQVLQDVARRVMADIRTGDTAGRWDGDQFMILLPETDGGGASVLAERLRLTVADFGAEMPDGTHKAITASFGSASGTSVEELVRGAESRLMEAKRQGGNSARR